MPYSAEHDPNSALPAAVLLSSKISDPDESKAEVRAPGSVQLKGKFCSSHLCLLEVTIYAEQASG